MHHNEIHGGSDRWVAGNPVTWSYREIILMEIQYPHHAEAAELCVDSILSMFTRNPEATFLGRVYRRMNSQHLPSGGLIIKRDRNTHMHVQKAQKLLCSASEQGFRCWGTWKKCSLAAFISGKAMVKLLIFLKVQFPCLADGASVS